MGKIFFGTLDGKEIGSLDTISEVELTAENEKSDFLSRHSESFECEMKLESVNCGAKDPYRFLASGCDQGRYNGMTLKEDGYLSPKNGWIK